MGVELVIVRHGRTEWNREVRFRGRMDLPLDEVGHAQARAAARAIAARRPAATAVYASPLLRAQQTAAPIAAALGTTVQPHPGLVDVDYGRWTGLTPAEAESRDPALYHLWRSAPGQVHFPDGESLAALQLRLQQLLPELEDAHQGQTIVLVAHIVVNRVLLCTLLGLGLDGFWRLGQDNGAVNLAHYENGSGSVLGLNDTCHLQE